MLSRLAILFSVCLLYSSCATIICGIHQPLKVSPNNDTVFVNGIVRQNQDSIVKIRRKVLKKKKVLIKSKNGDTTTYRRKFNEVSLLNFIIPPFWLIDLLTGSVVKYENQNK